MPVVDTTQLFATGDTVTSTTLNNIMDQSIFVYGAVVSGSGLAITDGGQMTISDNTLPGGKITNGTITSVKIQDGTITNANISASAAIATSKLASGALSSTVTVGTANITNGSITSTKLSGNQTGSAPIYGVRAWGSVNSNGSTKRSQNISSITKSSTGNYTVNFTVDMPASTYAIVTTTENTGSSNTYHAEFYDKSSGGFKIRTSMRDTSGDRTSSDADFDFMVLA